LIVNKTERGFKNKEYPAFNVIFEQIYRSSIDEIQWLHFFHFYLPGGKADDIPAARHQG